MMKLLKIRNVVVYSFKKGMKDRVVLKFFMKF